MSTLFRSSMIAVIVSSAGLYGMEKSYWQDFPGVGFVPSPMSSPASSPSSTPPQSSPVGSPVLAPSKPNQVLRAGCLLLLELEKTTSDQSKKDDAALESTKS